MVLLMLLAIGYEVSGIWYCCVFHSWCQQAYGVGVLASQTPQKPGRGCDIRMLLDCLCLLHVFIYLVSLLSFRSVLLLARQEYRSPGLWFIREKAVIQTTVPGSLITWLRVKCDCLPVDPLFLLSFQLHHFPSEQVQRYANLGSR